MEDRASRIAKCSLRLFILHPLVCEKHGMPTMIGECTMEALMRFAVTIDRDEDGVWVIECPAIPGCVSQGKTKDEAMKNIEDAIKLCLEVRAERGLPLVA